MKLLKAYIAWVQKYSHKNGIAGYAKVVSKNTNGTCKHHTNPQSNTNVIPTLPPERNEKYEACASASNGMRHALIKITCVAKWRTTVVVLYISGIQPEHSI